MEPICVLPVTSRIVDVVFMRVAAPRTLPSFTVSVPPLMVTEPLVVTFPFTVPPALTASKSVPMPRSMLPVMEPPLTVTVSLPAPVLMA